MANAAIATAVLAALIASACVPVCPTVRKEKTGRVVDAQSGEPIAGAIVRVESFRVPTPPGYGGGTLVHSLEVRTDAAGRWEVPSERDWTIGFLAADGLPLFVDVYCVFADGYQTAVKNPYKTWLGMAPSDSENEPTNRAIEPEVRLERGNSTPPSAEGGNVSRCGVPL